jgi:hypothetical protein
MFTKRASEAKAMGTGALNRRDNLIKLSLLNPAFNGIFTVRGGTPLQILLIVNISSGQ